MQIDPAQRKMFQRRLIFLFQQKEEELHLSWDNIWRAYQRKGCVYLYATPAKAFLLPSGQADAPDQAVLEALKEKLPPSKLFLS